VGEAVRKPIEMREADPHPWRVERSKGGKLFIYGAGEQQPVSIIRTRLHMTRREIATLQLICDAVNDFRYRNPQFRGGSGE
jgi:hypothetical protein